MNKRNEPYAPLLCSYPDSEKINKVSEGAEAMFCRLLAKCDDDGNYHGAPVRLLGKLFTLRYENGTMNVRKVLRYRNELVTATLITCYEVDTVTYIHINNCKKSLRKDVAKKVIYPEFTQDVAIKELNESVTERNENVTPIQSNPNQSKPIQSKKVVILFENFWEVYPRKVAKKKAQERWLQINPDEQLAEQIIAAVRAQKASGLFKEMDFTPHPATWLNAGRWTDQLPKEAEKASHRRADADVNARKQESERQEAAAKARKNLEFAETIKKFSDGQLAEFWRKSVNSRTEIERMRPDRKELFDKLRLGV